MMEKREPLRCFCGRRPTVAECCGYWSADCFFCKIGTDACLSREAAVIEWDEFIIFEQKVEADTWD
jgi:hypothetical protein